MAKIFKSETVSYKTPEFETPYQKARQEWDNRLGDVVTQAKNWRFVAVLCSLVSVVLLGLLIASFSISQNHVFVAEVTQEGRVVNVSPLMVAYQPTQAQLEYFLGRFIQLVRGLPLDPVVAKQNWLEAYDYLTQQSAEKLNRFLQQNNSVNDLGKKTIVVKLVDINALSDHSFEVDWLETSFDLTGQKTDTKRYSGVFTVVVKQPKTQTIIMKNPLGVYIVDFNISSRDKS